MFINNAVKDLHVRLNAVIKSPLHDGHKYVSSILEVAEKATTDGSKSCRMKKNFLLL
jgi:hypothetical protein